MIDLTTPSRLSRLLTGHGKIELGAAQHTYATYLQGGPTLQGHTYIYSVRLGGGWHELEAARPITHQELRARLKAAGVIS